jgi:hypothetical protein
VTTVLIWPLKSFNADEKCGHWPTNALLRNMNILIVNMRSKFALLVPLDVVESDSISLKSLLEIVEQ